MDVEIKGAAVTKVEDTRLIMALESMRRIAGQTYVSGTFHFNLCTVPRDVGETAFEPDVQFVEILRNVGDGRDQAASGCWLTASMPSMNFMPVISFGN
jgi:hypothetical protein